MEEKGRKGERGRKGEGIKGVEGEERGMGRGRESGGKKGRVG